MDAATSLPDSLEHIVELLLAAHEQMDVVALSEAQTIVRELTTENRVASLCPGGAQTKRKHKREDSLAKPCLFTMLQSVFKWR